MRSGAATGRAGLCPPGTAGGISAVASGGIGAGRRLVTPTLHGKDAAHILYYKCILKYKIIYGGRIV